MPRCGLFLLGTCGHFPLVPLAQYMPLECFAVHPVTPALESYSFSTASAIQFMQPNEGQCVGQADAQQNAYSSPVSAAGWRAGLALHATDGYACRCFSQ